MNGNLLTSKVRNMLGFQISHQLLPLRPQAGLLKDGADLQPTVSDKSSPNMFTSQSFHIPLPFNDIYELVEGTKPRRHFASIRSFKKSKYPDCMRSNVVSGGQDQMKKCLSGGENMCWQHEKRKCVGSVALQEEKGMFHDLAAEERFPCAFTSNASQHYICSLMHS